MLNKCSNPSLSDSSSFLWFCFLCALVARHFQEHCGESGLHFVLKDPSLSAKICFVFGALFDIHKLYKAFFIYSSSFKRQTWVFSSPTEARKFCANEISLACSVKLSERKSISKSLASWVKEAKSWSQSTGWSCSSSEGFRPTGKTERTPFSCASDRAARHEANQCPFAFLAAQFNIADQSPSQLFVMLPVVKGNLRKALTNADYIGVCYFSHLQNTDRHV